MRRDPRVAISVADRDDPYDKVCIRGRVVEIIEGEEADRQIDRARQEVHRAGTRIPWRRPGEIRVKMVVEPDSVAA